MKSETKTSVAWLNPKQAAVHLGFVKVDGTPDMGAFKFFRFDCKPRTYWIGRRMRFRRADLDACVDAEPVAVPMRVLAGGRR